MSYPAFINVVMLLQLLGAAWLTWRGRRRAGYFFGFVAVTALLSLSLR